MTEELVKCNLCGNKVPYGEMYEYRGHLSCEECFDDLQEKVNNQRNQIIEEERHKTDRFKGLDLSDSTIGKANKSILKSDIEIASKESKKLSDYERRKLNRD